MTMATGGVEQGLDTGTLLERGEKALILVVDLSCIVVLSGVLGRMGEIVFRANCALIWRIGSRCSGCCPGIGITTTTWARR